MSTAVVTLTYNLTPSEDELITWGEELESSDASVAYVPGRGVTITVWVEGFDPVKAPVVAVDLADRVIGAEPIGVEVQREQEYLERADQATLPEMVSAPEVADLLEVSRQRVHQLRSQTAFPEPLFVLRTGPIWDARAVRHFAQTWDRKPGRPRKSELDVLFAGLAVDELADDQAEVRR